MVYPIVVPFVMATVLLDNLADEIPTSKNGLGGIFVYGLLSLSILIFCYDSVLITNKAYLKQDIIFKESFSLDILKPLIY